MPKITGTLLQSTGADRRTSVSFKPKYAAKASGNSLVTTTTPTVVSSHRDGTFEVNLIAGQYEVTAGSDVFTITVAASPATQQLTSIMD